jgi:hypothetical protein
MKRPYSAALLIAATLAGCSSAPERPPRPEAELMADLGELRPPAKDLKEHEADPIDPQRGLQSRREGLFEHVAIGKHGDRQTKYLWTIDDRGINLALEMTPFATPRGHITHTNLSRTARFAGEAWFTGSHQVTINGHSGRFGDRAMGTPVQYQAAVECWERLGYTVNAIPLGKR